MAQATFAPASRKQQMVLESEADILVIGGAAGSGKSYLLQLMPLLIVDDPNTACIMFRRTVPQIRGQGGLFDKAKDIYNQLPPEIKPKFRENEMTATFPNGALVQWKSMQHESNKLDIQGLEYTFIGVDEGTQFTWTQLEYMTSRLRSNSKYKSRMVISCNPDPDHELRNKIDWYLDEEGYPIPERDGVLRYYVSIDDVWHWGDSVEELKQKYGKKVKPTSFSFISSTIKDNPPMMINNPGYLAMLEGLNEVEKARLLHGNWNARPAGASYFQREFLTKVFRKDVPLNVTRVRPYDKAGTSRSSGNKAPDFTASVGIAKDDDGFYYLYGDYCPEFVDDGDWSTDTHGRFCKKAGDRDKVIEQQAAYDGDDTIIIFSVDPGQAGISEFTTSSRRLLELGYIVEKDPMPGNKSKLTRFSPFALLAQNGFVKIVEESFDLATLNALYKELEKFDGQRSTSSKKDDWCDAIASGINFLERVEVVKPVILPRISAPTMYASMRRR
nr:MAG: terminase large subunit [Caudoviricetes sp.]